MGQIISVMQRCLPLCFPLPESKDQNEDVHLNSTTRSTSSSTATTTFPLSFESHWDYDVFLSFRGEDTRKNFTDHLYSALVRLRIRTFRDDEELPRGENISTELRNAIRRSRFSIVVFSEGYASSRWCLDELAEIVHSKNTIGSTLLPVFYHVNPSDVRKQTGTFAKAFARHEERARFQTDMEMVQRWRASLTEAANCSGWDLESVANGYESRFIKAIVEEVLYKVNPARLNVAQHPIGIDSHVVNMRALLNLETSDVCIVGIYGMCGIGKTTIANAVYNEICVVFEGSSFLSNLKESSEKPNGLVHLQEQLLNDILKTNLKIDNVDMGIIQIKERLHRKRVLVILDDVDHKKQLQALVGNFEWFGSGSRIIVTTRDEHLLTRLGVDKKYKVGELNNLESLQLFSYHAFGMAGPTDDYKELLIRAAEYARGLPLALEVLGSFLFGRSVYEWKSELEKLQRIPHKEIQKILKLSFKSLDRYAKMTFLDIACFFIGMDKEYAIRILHGCGFFPNIDLSLLVQRSLVTIDLQNKLRMHDLIRDMGREIVRKMSPYDLGKLSRLWFHEDALNVLGQHTGTKAVEGLVLNLPVLEDVHLRTEAFAKMKNLRLLEINTVSLTGCFEHLSKELRWLCWHKCPLELLPQNFHLENLVVLDMQHSNVKQIWKDNRVLNKLKVLNLSYSKNLTKSPNFLQVPHLEMLILEGCTNLVELHESIEQLKGLVLLNLNGCNNLKNLPRSLSNFKSLERLNLSGCLKLDELPEKLENMISFKEPPIERTSIKQLPYFFGLLKNLKGVSLSGCKDQFLESRLSSFSSWISPKNMNPISLLRSPGGRFGSLGRLSLSNCKLSEDEILDDIGSLTSLQGLDLSENNFSKLPDCIRRLPKLQYLYLDQCKSLLSISELPANVEALFAPACSSLETLSISPSSQLVCLNIFDCCKLVNIEGLSLDSNSHINLFDCNNLSSDLRKSLLQCPAPQCDMCNRSICLPGTEVPDWFCHKRTGSSISFHVPSLAEGEIRVLLICIVYAKKKELDPSMSEITLKIHNKTRDHRQVPQIFPIAVSMSDHLLLGRWHVVRNKWVVLGPSENIMEIVNGEEMEVSFELSSWAKVKKCGVHIVVDRDGSADECVYFDAVSGDMDTTIDD